MGNANIKSFCRVFIPVLLFLFVTSFTSYIERVLLALHSEEALAGSLNGFFLVRVFQAATLSVIIGGQAFVGLFNGAQQPKQVGSCIWQLIWFSLGTSLVVPPIGFFVERLMYESSPLAQSEGAYFYLLCWFNFLIPLVGALSAFYLGRGKTFPIIVLTVAACVVNIGLDYIFIFGNQYVSPMGVQGAALGKVITNTLLCLVLGILFLSRSNREHFGTGQWRFEGRLFYHYIKPGLLRGLGAFFCLGDWALVTRKMSLLSETHRLVFECGSLIFYFFIFFADALYQSMVTIVSNNIGKKQTHEIWNSVLSAFAILGICSLVLCVPFFLFPGILTFCFRTTPLFTEMVSILPSITPWIWMAVLGYGLNMIGVSIIIASRDTLFLFCVHGLISCISFVPVYITMDVLGWSPDKFWLLVFFANVIIAMNVFRRASQERWIGQEWSPAAVYPKVEERTVL